MVVDKGISDAPNTGILAGFQAISACFLAIFGQFPSMLGILEMLRRFPSNSVIAN
jgi:hypothetical protein